MKIQGTQKALDRYVRWASAFTETSDNANPTHKAILIDADEDRGVVTFTAEGLNNAITFKAVNLDVSESGQVLVDASGMSTAIRLAAPDDVITVASTKDHALNFTWGTRGSKMNLPTLPLVGKEKVAVPQIREHKGDKSGVTLSSEDFVRGWRAGSVAHERGETYQILKGAHVGIAADKLRFTTLDGNCSTFFAVPYTEAQEDFAVLLPPDRTTFVLSYIELGDSVQIIEGEDESGVHLLVRDEKGAVIVHIRIAAMPQPIQDFPIAKTDQIIRKMLGDADVLVLDRDALVRLFISTNSVLTYNKAGQERRMKLTIDKTSLSIDAGGLNDESRGSDVSQPTDVQSWTGDETTVDLKWGLYGPLITAYPTQEDGLLRAALLRRKGVDTPFAMALFLDGWDPASGDVPTDYIAVIPFATETR